MAAHKAVINVSASVLPDNIKTGVSGTAIYNLNDVGNDNKWVHYINSVGTASEACIPSSVAYLTGSAGETGTPDTTTTATDDVGVIIIKHTGYQGDGVTKTASDTRLYINVHHGVDAGPQDDLGNMFLLPGEVWWGRFYNSDMTDIQLEASVSTINAAIYAIADDGGV